MWKDIDGYDGTYQVNENGSVRNATTGRVLKPWKNKFGYLTVKLWKHNKGKEFKVHRLVAIAFIPNPYNKPEVNHIDCDRTNNVVSNLEWVTSKENSEWCVKMGRRVMNEEWRRKIIATRKRKPVIGTNVITGEIIRFNGVREAESNGYNSGSVIDCCKGRRKTAYGFTWKYADMED